MLNAALQTVDSDEADEHYIDGGEDTALTYDPLGLCHVTVHLAVPFASTRSERNAQKDPSTVVSIGSGRERETMEEYRGARVT